MESDNEYYTPFQVTVLCPKTTLEKILAHCVDRAQIITNLPAEAIYTPQIVVFDSQCELIDKYFRFPSAQSLYHFDVNGSQSASGLSLVKLSTSMNSIHMRPAAAIQYLVQSITTNDAVFTVLKLCDSPIWFDMIFGDSKILDQNSQIASWVESLDSFKGIAAVDQLIERANILAKHRQLFLERFAADIEQKNYLALLAELGFQNSVETSNVVSSTDSSACL